MSDVFYGKDLQKCSFMFGIPARCKMLSVILSRDSAQIFVSGVSRPPKFSPLIWSHCLSNFASKLEANLSARNTLMWKHSTGPLSLRLKLYTNLLLER